MAAFLAGVFAQVLRIAAPCQEKACCHFDGTDCRLATRLVQLIPAVVESLPACRIRPDCRWFLQVICGHDLWSVMICGQTGLALCGGKEIPRGQGWRKDHEAAGRGVMRDMVFLSWDDSLGWLPLKSHTM
jgi:hypothetical protein